MKLTKAHDLRMQSLIDRTPIGMAHWIGTGPETAACVECRFFRPTQKNSGFGAPHMGRCAKFKNLTGREGARFKGSSAACRFFEAKGQPHE